MKPSHNLHESLPYNGSTPHILSELGNIRGTVGQIQGTQEAQSEDIREIRYEQRDQGGRLRSVETSLTKLQERSPWWANDRLWLLLAGIALLLLVPAEYQTKLFERLLK
jgi:hypothetical protein